MSCSADAGFGVQTASRVNVRSRRAPQPTRATESRANSHASASSRIHVRRPTRSRRCGTGERSSSNTKLAAYTSTEADPSAVDPGPDGNWSHVDADFLYRSIEDKLAYLSDYERSEVHDATRMAFNAHDGQRRKSGEPFVTHPVAVAGILADQRMDHETVIAGLLHDTVEDTEYVTFDSIQTRFGPAVRRIVEGETKVSKVSSSVSKQGTQAAASTAGGASGLAMGPMGPMAATPTPEQALAAAANVQADDLKEMFLAMTQDVRVIIVKLADRLHNMRTLGALKPEKRVKIARETLLVFAPLAKLLGMYNVKNELEELAFKYAAPETYAETARWFDELSKRQDPVVRRAQQELQELCDKDEFLKQACDRVEVLPRAKEFYGLFRKANDGVKPGEIDVKNGDVIKSLRKNNEVAQLRVILHLKGDDEGGDGEYAAMSEARKMVSSRVCYQALSMVHALWPPVPGRMKDYIATPKLNGYRALHTVVLPIGSDQQGGGPERQGPIETEVFPLELQIRTVDMHRMAESGIAADGEVKAAWRLQAKRTARKLRKQRKAAGLDVSVDEGDSSDSDEEEEEVNPEESVMVRSGHARQVEWLSNIRQWQEEFLGVITAEEFVDTVTGDLLGRRVFVFTPSGGVMNMPHGATVVDYAFYTDAGLDMIEAKVNGVAVEFSCQLRNADVVEIISQSAGGYDFVDGAGESTAAALAGAVAKQKIALQTKFLDIARTRSAKYKIKKFLAEQGVKLGDEPAVLAADVEMATNIIPTSDVDVIDDIEATEAIIAAAQYLSERASAMDDKEIKKYSLATVWLRCTDHNGLLAGISDIITKVGGCSIVGYGGDSADSPDGQFDMSFTLQLDPKGKLMAVTRDGDADVFARMEAAQRRLMEIDSRLTLLYQTLRRNEYVLESELRNGEDPGRGWAANIGRHDA